MHAIRVSLEQLWGRLRMAVGRGAVTASSENGTVQMLQVQLGPELRDNLPRLVEYGFASRPHAGADVIVLFAAGDRSNGVVVATGDQRYRFRLAEGEAALYDDLGQSVHLTRAGIVVKGAGLPITISDTPTVRIETERVEVTGDIIDHCDSQPHTVADMRSIYNGHTHQVPNVQGGQATVTANAPTQQE